MISSVVVRVARSFGVSKNEEVDDLVQDIYLKFLGGGRKALRDFRPTRPDSAYAFIKAVTANAVRDHFRSSSTLRRGGGQPTVPLDGQILYNSEHSASPAEIERQVLLRETGEILNELYPGPENERNRDVFWLYYRQGLTFKAIAGLPATGLTESGVESLIYRMTSGVRTAMVERSIVHKWFSDERSL